MINILDIDCGRGSNLEEYHKEVAVTGIDIDEKSIKVARKRFPQHKFYLQSAEKIAFPDESFDTVYCIDILEHVDDPLLVLYNINRVLKKSGKLIIEIPYYLSEKLFNRLNNKYSVQVGHQRIFDPESIINLMDKTGYLIKKITPKKFIDNVYYSYFFLKDVSIKNQQGDLDYQTENDRIIANTILSVYQKQLPDKQKLMASLIRLVNNFGSMFFPKSIRIELIKSNSPKNKFHIGTPKLEDLSDNLDLCRSYINKQSDSNKYLLEIDKLLKTKDKEIANLKSIVNSKYMILYPSYLWLKKIIKKWKK